MPYIRFKDTPKVDTVTAERGALIWKMFNGEIKPRTASDQKYIARIDKIYLSRFSAPPSYFKAKGIKPPEQPLPEQARLI